MSVKQDLDQEQVIRSNETVSIWILHMIVVLLMTCLGFGVLQFSRALFPGFDGAYIPLVIFLFSIEALISWRRTRRWMDLELGEITYWLVEWIVLLVAARLFLLLWRGQIAVELAGFRQSFFGTFFETEMLLIIGIAFFSWLISGMFAKDILELEGDISLLAETEVGAVVIDRKNIRRGLVNRVFSLGFLLVLVVALTRVDFQAVNLRPPPARWDMLTVLLYFMLSLAFFSLTNYAALRGIWAWNKLPVTANMAKRWIGFSLVFLVLIALLAFILPTQYSLSLLSTLRYLLNVVSYIGYILMMLILIPLFSFFRWLARLMQGKPVDEAPLEEPLNNPSPLPFTQPSSPLPWLELLKSLVFWSVLILVVGWAFYQYARQNQALVDWFHHIPFFRWLGGVFSWFHERLQGISGQFKAVLKAGYERVRSRSQARRALARAGYVSLRKMTPRQRVIFFYLALVRRGGESGLSRRPDQTPSEYARSLEIELDGAENELDQITASFLEARYSQHDVSYEKASIVRQIWDRLKRRLHRRSISAQ